MMTKKSSLITGSGLALVLLSLFSFTQLAASRSLIQTETTRKLWYPGMTTTTAKTRTKRRYRVLTPKLPVNRLAEDTVVGVTVYRLRPPRLNDPGARLLKHAPSGDAEWTPVRVSSDTPLAENTLVRLSIEAARSGYLYVIDQEQYADGSLGQPQLIFPTTKIRQGNNEVCVGRVIELPDREAEPVYFTLSRSGPTHIGELLTVLVLPQPLPGLAIGPEAIPLSTRQVQEWEKQWGAHAGRLEMVQGAGQTWTEEEKAAGGNPNQLLKPEAPTPQTLYYNPQAKSGDPILVKVRLRLAQNARR